MALVLPTLTVCPICRDFVTPHRVAMLRESETPASGWTCGSKKRVDCHGDRLVGLFSSEAEFAPDLEAVGEGGDAARGRLGVEIVA